MESIIIAIAAGALALVFAGITTVRVLVQEQGNQRMRDIGDAIREGANAFLRRRRQEGQEVHRFGDCELDTVSHRLFRKGVEVPLTPKEFRLLEFFVRRPGHALTRDHILRAVWGSGIHVTSRSVDRCINTLRGKIEPDPNRPAFIETIRDIGYRFETSDSINWAKEYRK